MADAFGAGDAMGAFVSKADFDMSAFYRHVEDTYANPHPQYRLAATAITTADILNGTILAEDLDATLTAKLAICGEIKMWMTSSIPTGYLLLDGSAVSRTTYADLFALWGVTFGVGDGATTFNVPDFKLRIPIGLSVANTDYDALGELRGALTHTMDVTEIAAHTHGMQSHTHAIDHGHSHTLGFSGNSVNTSNLGSHSHALTAIKYAVGGGSAPVVTTSADLASSISELTDATGDHQHTVTATGSITGSVTSVTGNSGSPSNNTTTSVGTTTPFSIMPPTIVVHFIVKY